MSFHCLVILGSGALPLTSDNGGAVGNGGSVFLSFGRSISTADLGETASSKMRGIILLAL